MSASHYVQLYRASAPSVQESMWERFVSTLRHRTLGRLVKAEVRELTEATIADIYYSRQNLDLDVTERSMSVKRTRWKTIEDLRKKYKGEAQWGNQLAGVITDFNASMQWGQGLRTVATDETLRQRGEKPLEQEVWEDFLDYNDLDEEGGLDLGVSGELDGQVLLFWDVDQKDRHVRVWTVPLLETKYRVEFGTKPWEPTRAVLYPGTEKEEARDAGEFVFIRLRGVSNGSYGVPTCARCIDEIEDLHKAKKDLRAINHLHAAPTPKFTAKNEQAKTRIENDIAGKNWKLGKAIVLVDGDDLDYVTIPAETPKPLVDEITLNVKFVSGTTSVPVHFLGFPDLMSNRAVAAEDFSPSVIHATKADKRFVGGFEELRAKVLPLYGQLHGRTYDPDAIDCAFPSPQKGVVQELVETWLPVVLNKKISHKTFLIRIGVEDPDEEIKRIVEELQAEGPNPDEVDEQEERVQKVIDLAQANAREAA